MGDWAVKYSSPSKRRPVHALQARSVAAACLAFLVVGHATADVVRAEAVTGGREGTQARAEDIEFFESKREKNSSEQRRK